jgi:hypothetical protein
LHGATPGDEPIHTNKVSSVDVGTQTEDNGCVNGCTSMYIDSDVNNLESFKVGTYETETNGTSTSMSAEVSGCLDEEMPLSAEGCSASVNKSISLSGQAFVCEEAGHNKDEGMSNFEMNGDIEYTKNEASLEDRCLSPDIPVGQEKPVSPPKQPFMSLSNVRTIIIENPHHETVTAISPQ